MSGRASRRPRVLAVAGTYLPGVKGGGHIRSIAALATCLGRELELFVLCRDRDFGDEDPYPNVRVGRWSKVGNAQVLYLPHSAFSARRYRSLLSELDPDVLYLNTPFSLREFVLPAIVALRSFPAVRVVVAPRGCLDRGALMLKRTKKRAFLRLLRWSRIPKAVTWQASTDTEAASITGALGAVDVAVASDFPTIAAGGATLQGGTDCAPRKAPGHLRVIFLSRVSPKKNLIFLLERLANVEGEVELTIAGPIEDRSYWAQCKRLIAGRLGHIRVTTTGTVAYADVLPLLASHHVFALPTLSENFGHVVLEALVAGCVVIVSDRTPWRGLEALGAGWDLPLEEPAAWEAALRHCCDMESSEFRAMSCCARQAVDRFVDLDAIKRANFTLFCPGVGAKGTS